jgi:CelD/BcsL family acetyltransferase involved in cellulose biosynthesis
MSSLTSRVFPASDLKPQDFAQWADLVRRQPGPQPAFYSPEYTASVAAVRPRVYVCAIQQSGRTVAYFPFQFRDAASELLRSAERVGEEMTDYGGLIADPDLKLDPERLLQLAELSAFEFSHWDESQQQHGLSGDASDPGLRIDLLEGPEAYWSALTAKDPDFVSDTNRRRRQILKQFGPITLRIYPGTASHADAQAALAELVARKRDQYARTAVSDALGEPWKRDLLVRLLKSQEPTCRPSLITMMAGDTWVASHFGLLNHNGTLHYWFPVYNTDLKRYAPGRLLVLDIINQSAELDIRCIDRGAGASSAKRDFANAEHLFFKGMWQRRSAGGLLARAVKSAQWRFASRQTAGNPAPPNASPADPTATKD